MKKIIQISEGKNAITLKAKPATQASYIKIFNSQNQLIRHSRSLLNNLVISAPSGKYFIETDGDFDVGKEHNKDEKRSMKSLYKHLDIDLKNNMLILKGKPFYQTDDLSKFLNKMVKNKKELQGHFEAILKRAIRRERRKILMDGVALEALTGGSVTIAEKKKFENKIETIKKNEKKAITAIKKTTDAGEMLKVIPRSRFFNF